MSWMVAIGASVAGTMAIAGATTKYVQSNREQKRAQAQLDALNGTPMPEIGVSPELQNAYDQQGKIAKEGYTPEEEAAYQNKINRLNTAKYNAALTSGAGSMAGVVGAGVQYGSLDAEQALFEKESALKRNALLNQNTIASQIQTIRTMNDQTDVNRRTDLEKAYGAAIATQKANKSAAIQEGFSGLAASGSMMSGMGGGAKARTGNTANTSIPDNGQSTYQDELGVLRNTNTGAVIDNQQPYNSNSEEDSIVTGLENTYYKKN